MAEIVEDNVGQIESQVSRLRAIASEFSLLGREQLPDLEALDLAGLLQEVRSLYPSLDGTFSVEVDAEPSLTVHGSRDALLKVLTNLVENARQAMGEAGKVVLSGQAGGLPGGRGGRRRGSGHRRRGGRPALRTVLFHQEHRNRPRAGDLP